MNVLKKIGAAAAALVLSVGARAQSGVENPVHWTASAAGDSVVLTAAMTAPWHIYDLGPYTDGPNATTVKFTLPEGVALKGELIVLDPSVKKFDEVFGMEIGTWGGSVRLVQHFSGAVDKAKITAVAEWQACDDGACLAPEEQTLTFEITPSPQTTSSTEEVVLAKNAPVDAGGSLWGMIAAAVLAGFAALVTPCVFPMVPMTVSFFIKGSGSKSRGRLMASLYGLSIVALYTVPIAAIVGISYFVGGETVTSDIFNTLATHWIPNVLFFLVFMVFAASFFGAFEITMPNKWVNKADAQADKGGLGGVFFMALVLVLVSFSCTGPIVAGILVLATSGGKIIEPIVTMLAFSAAFALPFTLFALFPSLLKNLPKSGGWLGSVKVVLGFIELALGLKFLSVADQVYHWGILDREVYLALWIVIFGLLGLYLLGKLRFKHDDPVEHVGVTRLTLAIVTLSFTVYLIPGMWGAPLKALSGYLPPLETMDFRPTAAAAAAPAAGAALPERKYADVMHLPHGLQGFFDLKEGMAYAKSVSKPVFVDFTGQGCVNCREMEANVWSAPEVLPILANDYVIIALSVDSRHEAAEADWVTTKDGRVLQTVGKINAYYQVEHFGVNAQPYYCLLDPSTGELLVKPRAYDLSVPGFVQFLKEGLAAYKK